MSNIYVIADAEINHNGDIDIAKKMIGTAKDCGAIV
jgi:sialic acid synthase SpsE